jgi:hypothetical protein
MAQILLWMMSPPPINLSSCAEALWRSRSMGRCCFTVSLPCLGMPSKRLPLVGLLFYR